MRDDGRTSVHVVGIELERSPYDVKVGPNVLDILGEVVRDVAGASSVLLVADDGLPVEHVARAEISLDRSGVRTVRANAHAAEEAKSLDVVAELLAKAGEAKLERGDAVVALGGGIVGDVAGFVAASYRRGIPLVQCPTTLLAMVDASVGGKTGVNLATSTGLKKNMVGAFWQPSAVLADVSTLATLDERVFRAGLAECVKHGLIAASLDARTDCLLTWIESNADRLRDRDPEVCAELVQRNVRIKAAAVVADERETAPSSVGGRALLNLGHTFGHALETQPGLSPTGDPTDAPLHHGEAIALGTVAACAAAESLGLMDADSRGRVIEVLTGVGLPVRIRNLPDHGVLAEAMGHDKKVIGGKLRIVVPEGEAGSPTGRARVVDDPPESAIQDAWAVLS